MNEVAERCRPKVPQIEADTYYTIKETAAYYKVHPVTIHRWIRLGLLTRDKVGPNTSRIKGSTILGRR